MDRSYVHRAAADRIRANVATTTAAARANPDRFVDRTFAGLERDFDYPRTATTEPDIRRFVAWAAEAGPDARTPTNLLDDQSELRFGSTTLELIHHGPAHTDNDCFIFDRRRNIVIAGDLLFHRHHPFVDTSAGATTVGWQRAVDRMLATASQRPTVVPGHGPVAGAEALIEQRRYSTSSAPSWWRGAERGKPAKKSPLCRTLASRGWGSPTCGDRIAGATAQAALGCGFDSPTAVR